MSLSQVSGCLSCQHGISLERLLPHLAGVIVDAAEMTGCCCAYGRVPALITVYARGAAGPRAGCTAPTGGGWLMLRSAAAGCWSGWRCGGSSAATRAALRVTFAEQVEGLTSRRARRTPPLARMLTMIALALAGRAGARLAAGLDLTAGRSSMLRLIMALPDPQTGTVAVLGVDLSRSRDYPDC